MKLSCWSMRPCGVHTRGWVASHEVETRKGDTHIRTTRWPEPSCRLPTRSEFRTLKQRVCVPRSSVQDFKRKILYTGPSLWPCSRCSWQINITLPVYFVHHPHANYLWCMQLLLTTTWLHVFFFYYSIDGPHICNTQLDTSAPAVYSGGSSPASAGAGVVNVSPPHSKVHLHILPKGPRFQAEEQYPPLPMSSWMHESAQFLLLMHGPW